MPVIVTTGIAQRHYDACLVKHKLLFCGRGGALVESMPFERRVVGRRDFVQVLHLQLPIALRRVNSNTV